MRKEKAQQILLSTGKLAWEIEKNSSCMKSKVGKRQKINLSKHKVKRGKKPGKPSFLVCFSRRGGPNGLAHTHKWCTIV
ncbi:hypothetical protein VP01_1577g2 [Puccinia sorghi]|uniref:Uncharacterized protein n=1 Tax=Puccinia sorghi TaxID=27349 RepID=A0A0L6VHR6_9BASI|nr:hypothetical protein VP01_1577g2 [Puccinia sorghi]